MNSGESSPGLIRTSPLNIHCSIALPGVPELRCGSSTPASELCMPTVSTVFCARAGLAISAPATRAARSETGLFMIVPCFCR